MLVAWGVLGGCALGGCAPGEGPPPLDSPVDAPATTELRVAGAEGATPLVRHLADVFESRLPGRPVVVDSPLGEAGGRAALEDGRLAAALVMTPVGSDEGVLLARSAVVVAVGPGVRLRRMDRAALVAAYTGERTAWAGGLPLRVLLRPADDAAQAALAWVVPALREPLAAAVTARRWPIHRRAETLRAALRTPGTLAVADRGGLVLHGAPTWEMALDEVEPVFVELRLLPATPTPPRLQAFIAFVRSPEGQSLLTDLGYTAVEETR